jgi:hypothetical protein
MKGEEMKGEKKSAALMLAHLISIAREMGCFNRSTCYHVLGFLLRS